MSSRPSYQQEVVQKTRQLIERGRSLPLSTIQAASLADPGVSDPGWVSRQTFAAITEASEGPFDLIKKCINVLGKGTEEAQNLNVPSSDVELLWTGNRQSQPSSGSGTSLSENEKFQCMMNDVKSPLTIMFFHGGGFTMSTPARYQKVLDYFAKTTGGRCVAFRYRLAPQYPFPSQLLDALVAYQSLLYPPSSAFHSPVRARSIVFAGDSAGASLALSLLQVILYSQRSSSRFRFWGSEVSLPSPAGVSMLSAGLELTLALLSWQKNARFDVFSDSWSMLQPDYPTCHIWPSKPPRGHPYCKTSMLDHPLVAPALAEDWGDSPPLWFAGGQERFGDSAKLAAERAAQQGVEVWYEEYEEMPHDFPIMGITWPWATTDRWPQSLSCMNAWAEACKMIGEEGHIKTGAMSKGLKTEKKLDVMQLTGLDFQEAIQLIKAKKAGWKD